MDIQELQQKSREMMLELLALTDATDESHILHNALAIYLIIIRDDVENYIEQD